MLMTGASDRGCRDLESPRSNMAHYVGTELQCEPMSDSPTLRSTCVLHPSNPGMVMVQVSITTRRCGDAAGD